MGGSLINWPREDIDRWPLTCSWMRKMDWEQPLIFSEQLGGAFPRFQAEMDCLPFADAQFDLVVFNAALHYSTHPYTTLRESLRCLRQDGHLLIVDSPIYHNEQSGLLMKEERHRQFFKDYGFRSDSVPSIEFLTYEMVQESGPSTRNRMEVHSPLVRHFHGPYGLCGPGGTGKENRLSFISFGEEREHS